MPARQPTASYVGQLLGADAILLLSIGLVLISTLPWVEVWFDGIDRAAIWHRRLAITGVVLLVPHLLLSANPHRTAAGPLLGIVGAAGLLMLALWAILPRWRSVVPHSLQRLILAAREAPLVRNVRSSIGGYERWRALHRTTGLFVAVGFLHGVLDGTPFSAAPILRWVYVAVGGIGLGFYVYRELIARFFHQLHDYQVESVQQIDDELVEVALAPLGKPMEFVPGQFALVYIEAKDGWHRHPFTLASAPQEDILRVTVKGLGDDTKRLRQRLEPGMPAVIGGPQGHFSYRRGTDRQLWIAGGVGVTPFLSWLRAADADLPDHVAFFYSCHGEAPYANEILSIADRHSSIDAHIVDTSLEGHLTPEGVLARLDSGTRDLSVFMCGPDAMLRVFQRGLGRAGVPSRRIYREYFGWR